ncbi:hypothetical protein MCOR27_000624 [Pyricularia oryzae]|uniref:Glutamine amidotransferase type-2 domain-containing protein n=1 Tax=Pyricularia grisea TaxID=148305 RepID=A0ABQ8NSK7_PYRGI|nr:hypothetical protein MCOR01_005634 [Pyricularia oryzae]KAI6300183.1 hypothetical protein MCOR33_004076 [Pyricularia grisea]KAH9434842.1 hypothetical protein MCOR02_003806 [Pyricularia oryzae]KAI6255707.1 hypothetical protein MCOR19_007806 [Pyricularia oryzae]KAI6270530.1 hypothetical protein MCOR26_008194 [Pyricularia oryzae]
MCGIHFCIRSASSDSPGSRPLDPAVERRLCSRGPDHLGRVEARFGPWQLSFRSTVLALRGDSITTQPFQDAASGCVLCWNGEAWRIRDRVVEGNDGAQVFELLTRTSGTSADETENGILDVLRSIEGPFSFVFFHSPTDKIYYGRDRLGRRSLVTSRDGGFKLCSIAESSLSSWQEVEADGIYCLDLGKCSSEPSFPEPMIHSWTADHRQDIISGIGCFNTELPNDPQATSPPEMDAVQPLYEHLAESLRLRILNVPIPPRVASATVPDTRVAVLFSGGLDCTVIARLCHELLPASQGIDLLNVAFENPRLAAAQRKVDRSAEDLLEELYEACPDRVTGRKSFAELLQVCPGRAWRFIAINVPYTETTSHRAEVISLIHPHNTEMDLSIAYALYFAARGQGVCYNSDSMTDIKGNATQRPDCFTPARILLSGLGADELFGGYTRHATAFSRLGYAGLVEELKLDVARLGKRNLGRDDRVMSSWGKEVRFPFLDERLVQWAIDLPVWQKCDFGFDQLDENGIEPGKRVLRLLSEQLGLKNVAREKKRAIQFGSRTAKMENSKVKGTTLIT